MGCGAVKSVIHEATWRGCAGTMTGAAKLSVGGSAAWPRKREAREQEKLPRPETMAWVRMRWAQMSGGQTYGNEGHGQSCLSPCAWMGAVGANRQMSFAWLQRGNESPSNAATKLPVTWWSLWRWRLRWQRDGGDGAKRLGCCPAAACLPALSLPAYSWP
jgi:hypothetical protein